MTDSAPHTVRFASGDSTIAALHYPGVNGACLVMAGGTGVTKEPATDPFAPHFHAAGFTVLALDFRRLGESGGSPRQVVRVDDQLDDYRAAIAFAATLPEVDPTRIAIWGFSLAGGHVLRVAAREPGLAAAIAQAPLADGPAIAPQAMRAMTPSAAVRLHLRAAGDLLSRRLLRRAPILIPLAGPRGTVASITTPDGQRGGQALDPAGRYPDWDQTVAAASALRLAFYRPGARRHRSRARCWWSSSTTTRPSSPPRRPTQPNAHPSEKSRDCRATITPRSNRHARRPSTPRSSSFGATCSSAAPRRRRHWPRRDAAPILR